MKLVSVLWISLCTLIPLCEVLSARVHTELLAIRTYLHATGSEARSTMCGICYVDAGLKH